METAPTAPKIATAILADPLKPANRLRSDSPKPVTLACASADSETGRGGRTELVPRTAERLLATVATEPQVAPRILADPLTPFTRRRRHLPQIAKHLCMDSETRDLGWQMSNCSRLLQLVMELPEDEQPRALLEMTHFCSLRLCPFCEWRRSLAWKVRLMRGLDELHVAKPKLRPVLLTLTVQNCPIESLRLTIQEMHRAWARMNKCAFFPTTFWLRRTEITYPLRLASALSHGRDSKASECRSLERGFYEAHPHIHVLLMVPPGYFSKNYVRNSEWTKQWMMAARLDYVPVVDVRVVSSKAGCLTGHKANLAAVQEVAKYVTKADDLTALGPDLPFLHWQLKGLRMIQASRDLGQYVSDRDFEMEECTDQDLIEASFYPTAEVMASWNEMSRAFELRPDLQPSPSQLKGRGLRRWRPDQEK